MRESLFEPGDERKAGGCFPDVLLCCCDVYRATVGVLCIGSGCALASNVRTIYATMYICICIYIYIYICSCGAEDEGGIHAFSSANVKRPACFMEAHCFLDGLHYSVFIYSWDEEMNESVKRCRD